MNILSEYHKLTYEGISEIKRLFDLWFQSRGYFNDSKYHEVISYLDRLRQDPNAMLIFLIDPMRVSPVLVVCRDNHIFSVDRISIYLGVCTVTRSKNMIMTMNIDDKSTVIEINKDLVTSFSKAVSSDSKSFDIRPSPNDYNSVLMFTNLKSLQVSCLVLDNLSCINLLVNLESFILVGCTSSEKLTIPKQLKKLRIILCSVEVVNGFSEFGNLIEVSIRHTEMRKYGPKIRHDLLACSESSIKEVDLSLNDLNEIITIPSSVERLLLRNNDLQSINDKTLQTLSNLETLALCRNNIKHITAGCLSNATKLKVFYGSSMMSPLSNHSIPNIFENLSKLEKVTIDNNRIESIGSNIFRASNSSLSYVDISYNMLTKLDNYQFKMLSNLRYLNLASNLIKDMPLSLFEGCSNLVIIDLSYNKFTTLPDRIFLGCTSLSNIILLGNNISTINRVVFDDTMIVA